MTRLKVGGTERYGLALLLILVAMVFIMAAPEAEWSRVVALIIQGAALLAALQAAEAGVGLRAFCAVTIGACLLATLGLVAFDSSLGPKIVRWASLLLILLVMPVVAVGIVKQVKEHRAVNINTMTGVLFIYLMLAMAFASAFGVIEEVGNEPFFRAGDGVDSLSNYLYYSLTTITTAGLGDFAPREGTGRSLTAAEALIGQIYLVTVVALIVGNLGRKR